MFQVESSVKSKTVSQVEVFDKSICEHSSRARSEEVSTVIFLAGFVNTGAFVAFWTAVRFKGVKAQSLLVHGGDVTLFAPSRVAYVDVSRETT